MDKQIYSLVCEVPDDTNNNYTYAVSFSVSFLENMAKKENLKNYKISATRLFRINFFEKEDGKKVAYITGWNYRDQLNFFNGMYAYTDITKNFKDEIIMNHSLLFFNGIIENTDENIEINRKSLKESGLGSLISYNPIKFDTYYKESIMNA